MTLSFVETMRGHLIDTRGVRSFVDFQVRAERARGADAAPGRLSVGGIVHAPGWAAEAPCSGTLTLGLAPATIAYEVFFRADDGACLVLRGAKAPSPLRPVRSMTELPIALCLGDVAAASKPAPLAHGLMHFDLLELPEFLVSWLPLGTPPRQRFVARHAAVSRIARLGA